MRKALSKVDLAAVCFTWEEREKRKKACFDITQGNNEMCKGDGRDI